MSSRAARGAYYNEIEPYAAQWLRNLIAAGLIPAGDVDERSIVEVGADDVRGYAQCHWFAGLGGWGRALRLAGWEDGRSVWTGSCPCQPFSVAGRGAGFADERHLWPEFYRLIRECRPTVVFGEQVAGKAGLGWLDGVFADLEGSDYACGAAVVPACGVGAPHRRERLWFVADAGSGGVRSGGPGEDHGAAGTAGGEVRQQRLRADAGPAGGGGHGPLADTHGAGRLTQPERRAVPERHLEPRRPLVGSASERRGEGRAEHGVRGGRAAATGAGGAGGVVGDTDSPRPQEPASERGDAREEQPAAVGAGGGGAVADAAGREQRGTRQPGESERPRQLPARGHGFWDDVLWLTGADGKSRRVKPEVRGVADGLPGGVAGLRSPAPLLTKGEEARVSKLRALGNAIVPQVAAEIIAAYMECSP